MRGGLLGELLQLVWLHMGPCMAPPAAAAAELAVCPLPFPLPAGINLDVLSVCAQQIYCVLTAIRERKKSFVFTGGGSGLGWDSCQLPLLGERLR